MSENGLKPGNSAGIFFFGENYKPEYAAALRDLLQQLGKKRIVAEPGDKPSRQ